MIDQNKRGFACIALDDPKTAENVGSVLRAAYCYNVAQVNISGVRGNSIYAKALKHGTNTLKAHRHIPTFRVSSPLDYVPHGAKIVVVELTDKAIALPTFVHPQQAVYVFGPEDGSVSADVIARADRVVKIPMRHSMNLAATVNVLLYDRLAKGAPFNVAFPVGQQTMIGAAHDCRKTC